MTRRGFLGATAAAPVAMTAQPYRLGVMTRILGGLPFDEALARVRKAGYRYVCPAERHAGQPLFTPELSPQERSALRRRMLDHGVEPFLSLGGFASHLLDEAQLKKWLQQLDLCADFEIPVMVGGGPWYYTKFPTLPKREKDWVVEVSRFYYNLEQALRHAESLKVTIALKPHTGITARAKDCLEVVRRVRSPYFKIAWDAGNVSFYEGIYPDPDLADLAPHVVAVCIKDHLGGRAEPNFPVPGEGQIDHKGMFETLFAAGFRGPLAVERLEGNARGQLSPDDATERMIAAYRYLAPLLDRIAAAI